MNAEVYSEDIANCESVYFNADTGNLIMLYVDTFEIHTYTIGDGKKIDTELREIELTAEQAAGYLVQPHYREHKDNERNTVGLIGGCQLLHSSAGGWYLYF